MRPRERGARLLRAELYATPTQPEMAKEEAASDATGEWVDFPLESPPAGSSQTWSLSQVSSTRPEATCSAVPHIKVHNANVVYNIVVPGGEVGKIFSLLESQAQSGRDHINKGRPRSPTKSTEDTECYATTRRDDREEYRRLQRRHYRRSEYSMCDSRYAHRSRRSGLLDR